MLVSAALLTLASCHEGMNVDPTYTPFDSNKKMVFSDFTPKTGSLRTRLFIKGENFGTDPSRLFVTVGGQEAGVVGAVDTVIYAMVPARSFSGEIRVGGLDAKGDTVFDYTFPERFDYQSKSYVGTLIRNVDEKGNSRGIIYGNFDEASVDHGDILVFQSHGENQREIYMSMWNTGISKFDLVNKTFTKVLPKRHHEMRSFTFTADGDTLLMPDDHGEPTRIDQPNIYYALRSEGFKKDYVYGYGQCSYTVASHPVDHTVFYQTWTRGGVYKKDGAIDPETGKRVPKLLWELATFFTAGGGQKMNFFVHPTGDYMYILGPTMHALLKSNYNKVTKEFTYPIVFAGDVSATGYVEGVGTLARFSDFTQCGTFVKNRQYVAEGRDDQYDFYIADDHNDCIRKVTPEGITSLAVGRANMNSDGKSWGYVNGDPTKEARLDSPSGICYDTVADILYWIENDNHCLRYLTTE